MHHCARIFCEVGLEFHLATMHGNSDDIHTHNIAQLAAVIMLTLLTYLSVCEIVPKMN